MQFFPRPGALARRLSCCLILAMLAGASLGACAQQSHPPRLQKGRPIETRPPELKGDHPLFPDQTRAPYQPTVAYRVTTLTDRLDAPWGFAFLPGGKLLITERHGQLRIFNPGDRKLSSPLSGVPRVVDRGQGGLLDVALDRHFASNHRIFLTLTQAAGAGKSQIAVVSAQLDQSGNALRHVEVIFKAVPALPRNRANNQGSRVVVSPDGSLFVTIGDRSGSPPWNQAQDLNSDLGKIVHITPEGKPASGNPFVGRPGARPEIWCYGVRNPQGLAFDPATGQLWETEHGPRGGDELNHIEPGRNYGWPVIVHGIDYPGGKIGQGIVAKAGMEQPRYYWDPVIAPSSLAFYTGNLFPAWKHSLFIGGLRSEMLDRLTLMGNDVTGEEPLLLDQHARIRDVITGPGGAVYVLTDGGKLLELTPEK